jgi:glutathione S-transferase
LLKKCNVALQILGDEVRDRFLGAHEKILIWMDNVRKATSPHELLFQVKARLLQSKAAASNQAFEPSAKLKIASKL